MTSKRHWDGQSAIDDPPLGNCGFCKHWTRHRENLNGPGACGVPIVRKGGGRVWLMTYATQGCDAFEERDEE